MRARLADRTTTTPASNQPRPTAWKSQPSVDPMEAATPWSVMTDVCPKCNQIHERCSAHSKQSGGPCRRFPIAGGFVCFMHAGGAQHVRDRAAARLIENMTERVVAFELSELDPKPVQDPLAELARLAGEAVAFKDLLREHLAELDEWRYTGPKGQELH